MMTFFHSVNPARKPATDLIKKLKKKKLISNCLNNSNYIYIYFF